MALVKCEECGKMISSRAEKCPQCGCPVTKKTKLICPECGCEVCESETKCSNCGCPSTMFDELSSVRNSIPDGLRSNSKNSRKVKVALIVAALVAVLFFLFKTITAPSIKGSESFEEFQEAVKYKYGENSKTYQDFLYHYDYFYNNAINSSISDKENLNEAKSRLIAFQNFCDSVGATQWSSQINYFITTIQEEEQKRKVERKNREIDIPSHAVKKFMRENLHTGAGLKDEEYYGR